MKYFFLVGEPSGDMHAANLAAELKKLDTDFSAKGFGGDNMQQQGIDIVCGLDRLSFMGFWEVIKNLRTIRQNFKIAKESILQFQPDVVIAVDYPGFNMRMAKWCKDHGFKVVYYILPQVWAWKENRIYKLKENCDQLIGVLPFEKDFYAKHQVKMEFVGHPLLDQTSPLERGGPPAGGRGVLLLPGSRKQEITRLLPIMLEVAQRFPQEQFSIGGLHKMDAYYPQTLPSNVRLSYEIDRNAKAAVVCSGTATLETALLNIPQIVIYKTGFLNYQIGKRLAKVNFISLPNLIAGKKIVEELIQHDCTADRISEELKKILASDHSNMYADLYQQIGEPGASAKAATIIFNLAG